MKKILFVFILFKFSLIWAENTPTIGSDINDFIETNKLSYIWEGKPVEQIPEGQIDTIGYNQQFNDIDTFFLVINRNQYIGIVKEPNASYLIDLNGDGILDYDHFRQIIPSWVLKKNTTINPDNDNLIDILDEILEMFNSDISPYDSGEIYSKTSFLISQAANTNTENRDLFFALYSYYSFGQLYPKISMSHLQYLTNEYLDRFGNDHPLFYLHTLETLLNMGSTIQAKEMLNILIEIAPDFVPGHVYKWQLETNDKLKEQYYKFLKEQYPSHWIVVQI
jgi:hypothetical protein